MFSVLNKEKIEKFNNIYLTKYAFIINYAINIYRDKLREIKNTVIQQNIKLERKKYSLEDMLLICFRFYDSLGINLYQDLKEVLGNENTKVIMSEPSINNRGKENSCNDGLGQIVLNPTNDLAGLLAVVHELCHAISQRMKENKRAIDLTIGEVESLFIEKVFICYLYENKIISHKEYVDLFVCMNNTLVRQIDYCFQRNDILNIVGFLPLTKESEKELEQMIAHDRNRDVLFERLKQMGRGEYEYKERYVIGGVVSTVLYDRYLNDREGVLKTFKKYMSQNAELNYRQMLEMLLGMDTDKTIEQFLEIKTLEREVIEGRESE